jgi:hypothetical protein
MNVRVDCVNSWTRSIPSQQQQEQQHNNDKDDEDKDKETTTTTKKYQKQIFTYSSVMWFSYGQILILLEYDQTTRIQPYAT